LYALSSSAIIAYRFLAAPPALSEETAVEGEIVEREPAIAS
jgi:hypothetical protein